MCKIMRRFPIIVDFITVGYGGIDGGDGAREQKTRKHQRKWDWRFWLSVVGLLASAGCSNVGGTDGAL